MSDIDLYGAGARRPFALTGGRLLGSAGEERLWEAVEDVLDTPRGTAPLDPVYGIPLVAYDVVSSSEQVAWALGVAIQDNIDQVQDVTVVIVRDEPGDLFLQFKITPRGSSTEMTRVYPWYRANI